MGQELKHTLLEGDKHGAILAVLVDPLPGGRYAEVSFWIRSSGHKTTFQCAQVEAMPIAKRLVTPVREGIE